MNQHSIYIGSGSPRSDSGGGSRLTNLVAAEVPSFQTTTFYAPPISTYHVVSSASMFSPDRKDFILAPMLCSTSESVSLDEQQHHLSGPVDSLETVHPAAVQADQMNAYIDTFFVDHEPSTSADGDETFEELRDVDIDVDDFKSDEDIDFEEERKQLILERQERIQTLMQKKSRREIEERELDELLQESEESRLKDELIGSGRNREERARLRRAEAARSRYQRMSESERRAYNQRRRLKQLGIDPDANKTDSDTVIQHVRMANAKKAEAARQRYHRMSLEEKREYNQRRTEAFRRRRMEEEMLLSTPAGRISAEALAKAQQIMIRNARKAEAARLRYQKMTPDERKEYNNRRAQAKRARQQTRAAQQRRQTQSQAAVNGSLSKRRAAEVSHDMSFENGPSSTSSSLIMNNDMSMQSEDVQPNQRTSASPAVASQDDIFFQMEREVEKRTKQAHMVLARQQQQQQHHQPNMALSQPQSRPLPMPLPELQVNRFQSVQDMEQPEIVLETHGEMLGSSEQVLLLNDVDAVHEKMFCQAQLIDEKALQQMLMTGYDLNGQPVEIRMADGTLINGPDQMRAISSGQKIYITQNVPMDMNGGGKIESAMANQPIHLIPTTSSEHGIYETVEVGDIPDLRYSSEGIQQDLSPSQNHSQGGAMTSKHAMSKARRAERARLRYHSMEPSLRQAQNAKRAEMLRKARARDDELCQLAESVALEQMDDSTRKNVIDAQARRAKRAEQARAKYHRMNSEERRQYNAMRDAQRRQRKREQENRARQRLPAAPNQHHQMHDGFSSEMMHEPSSEDRHDGSISPGGENSMLYSSYDMYPREDLSRWEQ
ncbi:unnamed protein product [Caenorhabditis auriculariae]|uniref:Uncharacterized protein n=1 Tax=Caenorhabditis auriculariae TaxID=2777116 RepID=A0A8S1GX49_9PELO|nr:unnamed protein product [Caenorhabditis auriculariae]